MRDNSESFANALAKSSETSASASASGWGVSGSVSASHASSFAQSAEGAWAAISDLSRSEKTEQHYTSKDRIEFMEGTTQIYARQVTTITIGSHSATDTKEVNIGVGLVKNIGKTVTGPEQRSREIKAWKDCLGVSPPATGRLQLTLELTKPTISGKAVPAFSNPGVGQTSPNEDGGHKLTIYLDRHSVMAPGSNVLTGFGLRRPSSTTIHYTFDFVAPRRVGPNKSNSTMWNDEDGGGGHRTIFLDRHKVMAPDGHFLTGFHLKRNNRGSWRYDYSYRQVTHGATVQANTHPNDWGNGAVIFLDRHAFKVPPGCALRGFQLYRPTSTTIAYRYWYAKIL